MFSEILVNTTHLINFVCGKLNRIYENYIAP